MRGFPVVSWHNIILDALFARIVFLYGFFGSLFCMNRVVDWMSNVNRLRHADTAVLALVKLTPCGGNNVTCEAVEAVLKVAILLVVPHWRAKPVAAIFARVRGLTPPAHFCRHVHVRARQLRAARDRRGSGWRPCWFQGRWRGRTNKNGSAPWHTQGRTLWARWIGGPVMVL